MFSETLFFSLLSSPWTKAGSESMTRQRLTDKLTVSLIPFGTQSIRSGGDTRIRDRQTDWQKIPLDQLHTNNESKVSLSCLSSSSPFHSCWWWDWVMCLSITLFIPFGWRTVVSFTCSERWSWTWLFFPLNGYVPSLFCHWLFFYSAIYGLSSLIGVQGIPRLNLRIIVLLMSD